MQMWQAWASPFSPGADVTVREGAGLGLGGGPVPAHARGASLGGMPGWFICDPALPRLERTSAGRVDRPIDRWIVVAQVVIVLAVSFKYLHSDAHTPQVRTCVPAQLEGYPRVL